MAGGEPLCSVVSILLHRCDVTIFVNTRHWQSIALDQLQKIA
jgi:hypothetical protein